MNDPPLARIELAYEVMRGEELICTGKTAHGFITKEGEISRPPARFMTLIRERFGKQD